MAEVAMAANSTEATDKALAVTELLENILSHLSMKDLIRAQAVRKQWRAVIHGSKVLRQNLFLEPRPPPPVPKRAPRAPNVRRTNRRVRLTRRPTNPHPSIYREMHPLLKNVSMMELPFNTATAYHFNNKDKAKISSWLPLWPSEQWENMLVTQPPPREVVIWVWGAAPCRQDAFSIENSAGVRLGEIAQVLKDLIAVEDDDGDREGMDSVVAEAEQVYAAEEKNVYFKIDNYCGKLMPNIVDSST